MLSATRQQVEMVPYLEEKALGVTELVQTKMREDRESLDLAEASGLEVNLSHPGHKMKIPESAQPFLDIRLNKVTLTPVFFLSLLLLS